MEKKVRVPAKRKYVKKPKVPGILGRPVFQPTEDDRLFVARCVVAGNMTIKDIAACLQINDDTLRKHFKYEIAISRALLQNKAVKTIDDALTDGSVDAAKFVLSRKAGWVERKEHDLSSADGSMSPKVLDLSKLPKEALEALVAAGDAADEEDNEQ